MDNLSVDSVQAVRTILLTTEWPPPRGEKLIGSIFCYS